MYACMHVCMYVCVCVCACARARARKDRHANSLRDSFLARHTSGTTLNNAIITCTGLLCHLTPSPRPLLIGARKRKSLYTRTNTLRRIHSDTYPPHARLPPPPTPRHVTSLPTDRRIYHFAFALLCVHTQSAHTCVCARVQVPVHAHAPRVTRASPSPCILSACYRGAQ